MEHLLKHTLETLAKAPQKICMKRPSQCHFNDIQVQICIVFNGFEMCNLIFSIWICYILFFANIHNVLSINDLCQASGLSHSQLSRKLKALTNKSPIKFIRSYRLLKAKELLQESEYNISEIAYNLGFNDPNYFSRMFMKEFGHSPSESRK